MIERKKRESCCGWERIKERAKEGCKRKKQKQLREGDGDEKKRIIIREDDREEQRREQL